MGQITIAGIAHLVERNLAKVEVVGSSPTTRSKLKEMLWQVETI